MKALFLVHGSKNIGMGHIMRTLSLASELQSRGIQVSYFSKYEQGLNVIRRHGFRTVKMPASELSSWDFQYGDPDELQSDLSFIKTETGGETLDVIVVDSYNVTDYFFRELKKMTDCLVYIDDLNKFPYPVDILVNGSVLGEEMRYERFTTDEQLLLGLKYNMVRPQFVQKQKRSFSRNINDIFISTGGSDPCYMTGKILHWLLDDLILQNINYHVILGSGFPDDMEEKYLFGSYDNIFFYRSPSDMACIMKKCDLAIVAGGSTVYELAVIGVPAMVFSYASNQDLHVEALERYRIAKNIGKFDVIEKQMFLESVRGVLDDFDGRKKAIEHNRSLLDGKGCSRIADSIEARLECSNKINRAKCGGR